MFSIGIGIAWFFGVYDYFGERMATFSGWDRVVIAGLPPMIMQIVFIATKFGIK